MIIFSDFKKHRLSSASVACVLASILFASSSGCGRRDLGGVTGMVTSNGSPRGFVSPEAMNLTFSTERDGLPRTFTTPVKEDGAFKVDMNDGSGRGIPSGTYEVGIDLNNLLMKTSVDSPAVDSGENEYPRPSADILKRLGKAKCSIQVTPGKSSHLVVDLDQGSIVEKPAP